MSLIQNQPRPPRLMRFWSPRSIRAKLLAAFIMIDVLLVLSIGSLSYFASRNALRNEALADGLRGDQPEQRGQSEHRTVYLPGKIAVSGQLSAKADLRAERARGGCSVR